MGKQEHNPWKDVLKRAMTDPAYRKALKANPAKVLAETGVKVDKATEYVVVEQDAPEGLSCSPGSGWRRRAFRRDAGSCGGGIRPARRS